MFYKVCKEASSFFSVIQILIFAIMCTHAATPPKEKLEKKLGKGFKVENYTGFFHAAGYDHPSLPVLSCKQPQVVMPYSWGLIPSWVREVPAAMDLRNKTLNARAETMWELPSFRDSAKSNRSIIFLDGFFEWRHEGRNKQPWFISMGGEPFAVAGLCSNWVNTETGEVLNTATIVTTPANELMSYIHNEKQRMPFIIPQEHWALWLDADAPAEKVTAIIQPLPDGQLKAHRISKLITSRTQDTNVPQVQQEFKDTLF
jgi:putative SOS response-associated peptidase YedK